ncbi:O-methyltransferase [Daejeonella sp.]|uniref:O-methyltransferase n=1 Tax=Daejeonella sp. TaxID=2805397 RepID=UPI00271CC984|nr:class I SAM-dependent methyltransferase [Daejeonella sp.]MDO8992418.1 class I SAM-dependent methyltransferase [Daejeonella sp.]MDP2414370.1 class I SAM-dependent methyltransferase [Daejeonella sp.]
MMKLSLAISFLKHQFKAKTRHGVHSPFVYRLLDEVIYDFRAKTVYQEIEQLRNDLEQNKRCIGNAEPAAVSHLAMKVSKPAKLVQLLYRLVADLKPGTIIELGTSLGITTAYLAKAAPEARLVSIMENSEALSITEKNLKTLNIRNVELLSGNSDDLLPKLLEGIPELDFILIDGNHSKVSILNYFKCCLPKMSNHSMMVFKDIYQNREMKSAWQEIKSHPEVSVTIDLFWIGLVFVRRAQRKEDFFIRF